VHRGGAGSAMIVSLVDGVGVCRVEVVANVWSSLVISDCPSSYKLSHPHIRPWIYDVREVERLSEDESER